MKKIAIILISSIFILVLTIQFGNSVFIMFENNLPSESIGSTNNGSLINEKRLPSNGDNFVTYSYFGSLLGRNSVHG